MAKFRYTGPQQSVSVGIAGAFFVKGVINEVPDERLAAQIRTLDDFEEVTADALPAVPPAIRHAPMRQGQVHPDPDVDRMMQDRARTRRDRGPRLDHEGVDGLGNINRADQYAANVRELSGEDAGITEVSADSGGEEKASPPASKPAGETGGDKPARRK